MADTEVVLWVMGSVAPTRMPAPPEPPAVPVLLPPPPPPAPEMDTVALNAPAGGVAE